MRFEGFNKETMPIIELFKQKYTCHTVNSIGKIDDIYKEIRTFFFSFGS